MKTFLPLIGMYTPLNINMENFAKIFNGILVTHFFDKKASSFMFHRILNKQKSM